MKKVMNLVSSFPEYVLLLEFHTQLDEVNRGTRAIIQLLKYDRVLLKKVVQRVTTCNRREGRQPKKENKRAHEMAESVVQRA